MREVTEKDRWRAGCNEAHVVGWRWRLMTATVWTGGQTGPFQCA